MLSHFIQNFLQKKYHNALLLLLILVIGSNQLLSQDNKSYSKKKVSAVRNLSNIKIDGKLDEKDWQSASSAIEFSENYPDYGNPEPELQKTIFKVLYDDNGIYFGARMFDNKPDSIYSQLTNRDEEGVADLITVRLNPYNDAQQEFIFTLSAAGVQFDMINTLDNGYDVSWDAIWNGAVTKDDKGWIAEIKIPYAAIRFPKKEINIWSVNFYRKIQRNRKVLTWSPIDRNSNNSMLFAGEITGIANIKTPTRLFIIPYASAYYNIYNNEPSYRLKAGTDIKWGISDNFTLDAILIPDFGQTEFDDVEYVLGPFEQEFEEKRPFFTEGTDLFSKGNLVYTRRIGQLTGNDPVLGLQDTIINRPSQTNLINAVKVSGRTSNGLGIGFANAVTDKAEVEILNKTTGNLRKESIVPLSNFNIIVLDQRYGKNNSITLVNTNVTRQTEVRDANVTALLSDNYFLDNSYNLKNEFKFSSVYDSENSSGFWYKVSIGETKGKNRFSGSYNYVSGNFDINDFGFNYYRNYSDFQINYYYTLLTATKHFNSLNINLNANTRLNNSTEKPEFGGIFLNIHSQNRKNNYVGIGLGGTPIITYDHYEPRILGRYMKNFRHIYFWLGISPNFNRKFLVEFFPNAYFYEKKGMYGYELEISPRWRISDRFSVILSSQFEQNNKNMGFVSYQDENIFVGERNLISTENELRIKYNFNPQSFSYISFRHYWTTLKYLKFYKLLENGDYRLDENLDFKEDLSYSNWNLDISWNYWFAPGSNFTLLYRHYLSDFKDKYEPGFLNNVNDLLNTPHTHSFSMKITYFIDANQALHKLMK